MTVDDNTTAPLLLIDAFDPPFGQAIQLQVVGTCGSASPSSIKATISVDIVCKD